MARLLDDEDRLYEEATFLKRLENAGEILAGPCIELLTNATAGLSESLARLFEASKNNHKRVYKKKLPND